MSKRILSDKDRTDLLKKYKEDKLNDAPANITDATLIKNYGSDDQKALLETAPKPAEGKKDETPNSGNGDATNGAIPATEQPGNVEGSVDAKQEDVKEPANTESPEYLAQLNNYISLNGGNAPESQLTLSELETANAQKIADLQAAAKKPNAQVSETAKTASPNLESTFTNKNVPKVKLINKETGAIRSFSKHSYDNYIKDDKNWSIAPETPDEVKHLTNG